MYCVIVGCGRLGVAFANGLSQAKHSVVVIDSAASAFDKLDSRFSGFSVEGDARANTTLEEAKVAQADLCLILTGNDNLNFLLASLFKEIYKVSKIMVRKPASAKEKLFSINQFDMVDPIGLTVDMLIPEIQKGVAGRADRG